jgi:hypothetical protein
MVAWSHRCQPEQIAGIVERRHHYCYWITGKPVNDFGFHGERYGATVTTF